MRAASTPLLTFLSKFDDLLWLPYEVMHSLVEGEHAAATAAVAAAGCDERVAR